MFEKLLLKLFISKIITKKKNIENSIEFDKPPKYIEAGSIEIRGK